MDEISSRKSVPPFAASKRPSLSAMAPVNAPFMWPNISLSSRFSGMAAQLTATQGRPARVEDLWIARAMTSLPVPDSPLISTVAAVGATFAIVSQTSFIAGEEAMKFSKR